jgi:hypothetical protein
MEEPEYLLALAGGGSQGCRAQSGARRLSITDRIGQRPDKGLPADFKLV